jgi:hypothetical protein
MSQLYVREGGHRRLMCVSLVGELNYGVPRIAQYQRAYYLLLRNKTHRSTSY